MEVKVETERGDSGRRTRDEENEKKTGKRE